MMSLACTEGEHRLCLRRSCACMVCGHPERNAAPIVDSPDTKPARRYTRASPPRKTAADVPMPEAAELYEDCGLSIRDLSDRYALGEHLISRALRTAGISIRPQGAHVPR